MVEQTSATMRDSRAPIHTRQKMSRPMVSVPNQFWPSGAWFFRAALIFTYSCPLMVGPSRMKKRMTTIITMAVTASGFFFSRRQAPCQ